MNDLNQDKDHKRDQRQTRGEELLAKFKGEWEGDMCKLFEEYNFL